MKVLSPFLSNSLFFFAACKVRWVVLGLYRSGQKSKRPPPREETLKENTWSHIHSHLVCEMLHTEPFLKIIKLPLYMQHFIHSLHFMLYLCFCNIFKEQKTLIYRPQKGFWSDSEWESLMKTNRRAEGQKAEAKNRIIYILFLYFVF